MEINRTKKSVLIVDDSFFITERLAQMLEDVQNIRLAAHAGCYPEAIEMLNMVKPDIVLLDINLPGRSGIDLLRTIRETNKDIIVMMVTNHASDQYRAMCKKLGATGFFDKSKELHLLPEAIASC